MEHIAPQERGSNSSWDEELYDDDNLHKIGNLTLLPGRINQSLSNKSWKAKWIYYKHLSITDPNELRSLREQAERYGVELQEKALALLKATPVNNHIASVVAVGIEGSWTNDLVQKRTEKLCDILWKRLIAWL